MNLIEQLGGYEKAKEVYENFKNDSSSLNRQRALNVKVAMLQYRRQHNIFEVGDKVVIKNEPFWPEEYAIQVVERIDVGRWYMSAWRHATDEEIKAGKRLEVNQ